MYVYSFKCKGFCLSVLNCRWVLMTIDLDQYLHSYIGTHVFIYFELDYWHVETGCMTPILGQYFPNTTCEKFGVTYPCGFVGIKTILSQYLVRLTQIAKQIEDHWLNKIVNFRTKIAHTAQWVSMTNIFFITYTYVVLVIYKSELLWIYVSFIQVHWDKQ